MFGENTPFMYWSQTESCKFSLNCLLRDPRPPFKVSSICSLQTTPLAPRLSVRSRLHSRVAVLRARTAYFKAVRLYKMRVYERCARALK